METIAILGWGSLLWDLDDLAPKVNGDWHFAEGPRLPFEFVRVSDKRKQALVVVIDYEHGAECETSYIASIRGDLRSTAADLAARERAQLHHIGHCHKRDPAPELGDPETVTRVRAWLRDKPFDGAVWTHLPRNFEERLGAPFSLQAAVDYLQALPQDSLVEARRYIELAPQNVETPLRGLLRKQSWWRDIAY